MPRPEEMKKGLKRVASAATSTVTTATVGNSKHLQIPRDSADDEPAAEVRIIEHGKNPQVVPAENSLQPPHRPAASNAPRFANRTNESRGALGEAAPEIIPNPAKGVYAILLTLFPEEDPEYLRMKADYFSTREQALQKFIQQSFDSNGLWTCQCCYDTECMPSNCSTCEKGHNFCNTCIINGTDSMLAEGKTHVPCFQTCDSEFSMATLAKVLGPAKYKILEQKIEAAKIADGLKDVVTCPFCDFSFIPSDSDEVLRCRNPECMIELCIE